MDRSMENGFSSPRTECFPVGLRVLVVDDDPTWLKILEKMLKKCCYEVTTCGLAREALDMLRGRKDGFDIVISDVNMPDMDGFKLLEHVGLEMDLPVIMMSVDGETSRVMKGVQHGACDYLLKPVRMKELKNIWQHVFRKKIHEVKDIESFDGNEDILLRNGSDKYDDGHYLIGGDISSGKKRKDMENRDYDDQEFTDPSSMKKTRVVWSVDLHQKFVNAVNQIGFDKVGPKKILDLMDVPWLTRENVASHLQKYRLYLSRLQKPNEPKIPFSGIQQHDFIPNEPKTLFCGIKQQDFNPKDPPASAIQSSMTMHQSSSASSSFAYNGNTVLVQDVCSEIYDDDLKSIISFLPITESRRVPHGNLPDSQKANNHSQIGLTHSFGSAELDAGNNISFGSSHKHSWSRESPFMQLKKQPKLELEQYGYTHLPLPSPHQNFQADCLQPTPSINFGTSVTERDKAGPSEIKPLCTDYRSNHVKNVSLMDQIVDPFSVQAAEPEILIPQAFGALSTTITGLPNIQNPSFNQQHYTSIWELDQRSLLIGSGSTLFSSQEELQLNFLQDYGSFENVELNNIEVSDYHDPELIADVPSHLYDKLRFNSDFLCESMEYPVMDQGLFIA